MRYHRAIGASSDILRDSCVPDTGPRAGWRRSCDGGDHGGLPFGLGEVTVAGVFRLVPTSGVSDRFFGMRMECLGDVSSVEVTVSQGGLSELWRLLAGVLGWRKRRTCEVIDHRRPARTLHICGRRSGPGG